MFNLIITIIAIALVVVLTATSVYYGGSAFSEGTADAIAATFVNQAQQVQASAVLFSAQEGGAPGAMADILAAHLSSNPVTPAGLQWDLGASVVFTGAGIGATNDGEAGTNEITTEVCDKVNETGAQLVTCVDGGDGSDYPGAATANAAFVTGTSTDAVIRMGF